MAEATEKPTPAPPQPRRRWFRFLYQFSLRTMLIGMTLAAIGCWWFLQPQVQEEELAGRYLKLRRQVRLVGPASDSTSTEDAVAGGEPNITSITSVGSWQLRDENDDLLVDGRHESDLPQGKWTLWYASGQKAAEGEAFRGGRTGLWRVWDERGTLRSEVTYRAVAPRKLLGGMGPVPVMWQGIPVVGMIGPLGQMAPPFQPPPQPSLADLNRYASQRHGPCRVWYASGKLQFEGQYAEDRRDGVWTYLRRAGRRVRTGLVPGGLARRGVGALGSIAGPTGPECAATPPGGPEQVCSRLRDDTGHLRCRPHTGRARCAARPPAGRPGQRQHQPASRGGHAPGGVGPGRPANSGRPAGRR